MINARAETAVTKPLFSASMLSRRCIIPAEKFYEWDYSKNKVEFTAPRVPVMLLAGFWYMYDGVMRFTVVTTEANGSMRPVHDRMPLMIPQESARRWLFDNSGFHDLLKAEMPMLKARREQEQLRMF